MIADFHTHIFLPEIVSDRSPFLEHEPAFKLLYQNPKARLVTADQLIASMDESGVEVSVTFGFPWQSPDLCRRGNDYVLEQSARAPNRLIPLATLPCSSIDDALAELHRCAQAGVAGFGELSFYCCDDPQAVDDWQSHVGLEVASLRLPSLWHVTEDVGHDYPGKGGMQPKQALALVERLCGATVVLAHWGGGLPFYELMPELAKACGDVYYDTAASPYLYDKKIFEVALSIIGPERILFGSDYPLIKQSRYLDQIDSLGLPSESAAMIKGNNLLRIFGRDDK